MSGDLPTSHLLLRIGRQAELPLSGRLAEPAVGCNNIFQPVLFRLAHKARRRLEISMNKNIDTQQVFGFALGLAFWWFITQSVQVAVGVIALLFVHEMGHFIAARTKRVPVSMPQFSPFGAYVQTGGSASVADEAYIKLAGPLVGGLAAVVAMAGGFLIGSDLMIQAGTIGVFLNLFNLIPLDPLDGGGIAQVFGRWTVIPGVLAFVYFFIVAGMGGSANLLFAAFIAWQAYQAYQARTIQWQTQASYFRSNASVKSAVLLAYLLVAGSLAWVFIHPGLIPSLLISVGL